MRTGDAPDPGRASALLFFCRTVYAFNWYNIAPVLVFIRTSFSLGSSQLAVIVGAFLVGAGAFQLPAGFAAKRWGNRTTSIVALAAMGAFSLASAASPNWIVLAALRFAVGAGAAFFFAPALGLVTTYYPPGRRGAVIGWYNAGFSAGSGVGLFGGALVGEMFGWPVTLALGGVLLLVGAAVAAGFLPSTDTRGPRASWRTTWIEGLRVLRSRSLWVLAVGTSGLWAAYYVAAQYFVLYANQAHASWGLALAAGIPAVMIAAEVPGGPLGGYAAERRGEMRTLLAAWGVASAVVIALIPFLSFAAVWPAFIFLGFADGVVFSILYLVPTYLSRMRDEEFALGLALLNSLQIFVGSALTFGFGVLVDHVGYTIAWYAAGVAAVAFLPLLLAMPPVRSDGSLISHLERAGGPRRS